MAVVTYTICFDFPELDDPLFPWLGPGGLGFTTSLTDAMRFPSHDVAERTLENGYPNRLNCGVVVETEWTCPSCGTVWPEREDGDDVTGCGECGRFIAEEDE